MHRKKILEAVTGSRAYGLNHALSDTDKMGVFVSPTVKVAGLDWGARQESWSDAGPEGDDNTLHEIGKFLKLALGSNPTLIELFFMPEYVILDETGKRMVELRSDILYTKGIRNAYYGYASAQYVRVGREYPNHKPKMARHCMRIARQGLELLETGSCSVRVPNPQDYFDLTEMPFERMMETIRKDVQKIDTVESVLPEEPNRNKIADFLEEVRRENVG